VASKPYNYGIYTAMTVYTALSVVITILDSETHLYA